MTVKQITIAILLTIFSQTSFATDLLDSIKSDSKLVLELKDTYRAFLINNIIAEQKEFINLYLNDNPDGIKTLLDSFIKVCDSIKQIHFNDEKLNSYVEKYLSFTIQNYNLGKSKGFDSPEFKKDFEKYRTEKGKYMEYLYSTYSTSYFINMTEDKYWQTIDKKNYIKSSDYGQYENLKKTNIKSALTLLEKIYKQTMDFQESSIYQIELADQYEKHADSLSDNASEIAIAKYKAILDQKKYSIYLFEAWLKWRTVTQQHNGLSKSSDIPNSEYDKVREQVALVILGYIIKNEKDEMAINEFLLMATHDIVKRFGDYPYGNQNTVEYHEIFDNIK